jgi:hypothetical protein
MNLDEFIARDHLIALLQQCPPDALLWLNNIGGISVMDRSGGYLGMISRHYLPNGSKFLVAWAHDDSNDRLPFA